MNICVCRRIIEDRYRPFIVTSINDIINNAGKIKIYEIGNYKSELYIRNILIPEVPMFLSNGVQIMFGELLYSSVRELMSVHRVLDTHYLLLDDINYSYAIEWNKNENDS